MKIHEQLRELRHYGPDRTRGTTFDVDAALAAQLPRLALPTMSEAARAAFRALLAYEAPTSNGSLIDTLALIEARGYTVHPCDWIPDFRWLYAGSHPSIYQSWSDYLSENGYTPFHKGNTLTAENCFHFAPRQRAWAFSQYIHRNDPEKLAYAKAIIVSQPAGVRKQLLAEINARGAFNGLYPWQIPFLREFLADKAPSVRKTVKALIDRGSGWGSEETNARVIASRLTVSGGVVTFIEPPKNPYGYLFTEFRCASFASLAEAMNVSTAQLAEQADLATLGSYLINLANTSGCQEVRHILMRRTLEEGFDLGWIPYAWFDGADPDLWRCGLEAAKASPYVNSVLDYPGITAGTMSVAELQAWGQLALLQMSVTQELETGKLPVNINYDPLRYLAKIVDKEAARIIMDEAIALGMSPDHPRLTMVKLNLAL